MRSHNIIGQLFKREENLGVVLGWHLFDVSVHEDVDYLVFGGVVPVYQVDPPLLVLVPRLLISSGVEVLDEEFLDYVSGLDFVDVAQILPRLTFEGPNLPYLISLHINRVLFAFQQSLLVLLDGVGVLLVQVQFFDDQLLLLEDFPLRLHLLVIMNLDHEDTELHSPLLHCMSRHGQVYSDNALQCLIFDFAQEVIQGNAVLFVVLDALQLLGQFLQDPHLIFVQEGIIALLFGRVIIDELELRYVVKHS